MKTPEVLQRLFSKAERSAAVLAVVLFAAVAALPVRAEGHALGQEQFQPDPLEPLNRDTHRFNSWAEEKIFEPLFNRYETQLTPTTRERLHNIFRNLQEPVIAVTSGLAEISTTPQSRACASASTAPLASGFRGRGGRTASRI